MNKFRLNLVAALLLIAASVPAFGQFYPLPASSTEQPAICTGCNGTNTLNQPNAGLPMFPYSLPIADHVGRLVDSANMIDTTDGMRTARAGKVRYAPPRGSFPGRVYVQLGATIAAYSANTFFSNTLPAGMQPADKINTGKRFSRNPLERIAVPDAWVYPEANQSGWKLYNSDGNDRLYDFDVDDRGYVYAAYTIFGWGIVRDDGTKTGTTMLPVVQQWIEANELPGGPKLIFTVKAGSEYYTVVSNGSIDSAKVGVYNTTNPNNKTPYTSLTARQHVFAAWAKSPDMTRVAIVDGNFAVRVYDARQFVTGGASMHETAPTGGAKFLSIAGDEEGNFWAIQAADSQAANGKLWKFAPSGAGYVASSHEIPNSPGFIAQVVDAGGGYVGVGGYVGGYGDVRIFKTSSGAPVEVDVKGFFRNYYHKSPDGFAEPESRINPRAVRPVTHDGKTYFIYCAFGLGDVYQLQVGDSVAAKLEAGSGEFYGDEFVFSSSSPTSEFPLNVMWDFGNPESGNANTTTARTGNTVRHRFSGISSASEIAKTKRVTVKLATDPAVKGIIDVNLKTPQARVKVVSQKASSAAPSTPIANGAELLVGDEFDDISDGQPDGHYNVWTVDGTDETLASAANKSAGGLGSHTLKYVAKYGPLGSNSVYSAPLTANNAAAINYKVLPFLAALKEPTKSGNSVTFSATGRYTTDTTVLPTLSTWDTTWTLKTSAGADVVPPQTQQAFLGTIPHFVVSQTIPENAVLKLTVSISTANIPAGTLPYATYAATTTLETPVTAEITPTGCTTVGAPCTLTATPAGTSNWDKVEWVVKLGSTQKFAGTGTTVDIANKLDAAGTYSVTMTVTRAIFSKTATRDIKIEPTLCNGPLPTSNNMSLGVRGNSSSCNGTNCTPGETVTLFAEPFRYNIQSCDTFTWTFGDGTASRTTTGPETTHTYAGNGPYTATLKINNTSTGATSQSFTRSINFGSSNPNPEPPPPSCHAPATVHVSYSGSKGCAPGVACKTDELVTFTVTKNSANLQSCDSVSWSFGAAGSSTASRPQMTFANVGTYSVTATVTNSSGSLAASPRTVVVEQGNTQPGCTLTPRNLSISYTGLQSGCSLSNPNTLCRRGETIRFNVESFNYDIQNCDTFLWNFGDGTATANTRQVDHVFAGNGPNFTVAVKVKNPNGEVNLSTTINVEGADAPATPVVSLSGPTTAGRNSTVTFSATSDIANTTGWAWEFSDNTGVDNSQNAHVGSSNSISHTFTNPGTYTVKVSARNAAAGANGSKGQATRTITITDVPEHSFLLPVVTHAAGQAGSVWRTDVQIYNPDPNVSASNPLVLKVTFNGQLQTITIPQATMVFEDFMTRFTTGDASGPMIVSATTNYQPRIWTRTYNQTEQGTFGQFIPAILLSGDGSGGAGTEAPKYYLAGLRQNDRYRTNVGFVNPNSTAIQITGTVYESEKGIAIGTFTKTLQPFTLDQTNVQALLNRSTAMPDRPFSVEVEAPAGKWVIAYASFIDSRTNDPTYLQAVRGGELASADYKEVVLPGVGRIGSWRSDVTVFNPDTKGVSLELSYYDQTGTLKKKTGGITLGSLEMLQLDDLLRTSQLLVDGDSLGALRLRVESTNNGRFPLVFGRTYFDSATGSYGQGITGVSAKRANVKVGKPGLIPAVRSTSSYYTNIGLTNVTDKPVSVRVTLLDADTGATGLTETYELAAFQSLVRSPVGGVDIIKALSPNSQRASFRVEIVGGTGEVWAYASVIDNRTKDPEYIAAIPAQ